MLQIEQAQQHTVTAAQRLAQFEEWVRNEVVADEMAIRALMHHQTVAMRGPRGRDIIMGVGHRALDIMLLQQRVAAMEPVARAVEAHAVDLADPLTAYFYKQFLADYKL